MYGGDVNARELQQWLKRQGCTVHTHKGGSKHLTVRRRRRVGQLPLHRCEDELGPGLVRKIKRDLGLE